MCIRDRGTRGDYRSAAAPEAKIACGICRTPLCTDCIAVDGVRCGQCFDAAVKKLEAEEQALRIKGPILAFSFCIAAIFVGVIAQWPKLIGIGSAAFMLSAIRLGLGYVNEWQAAREEKGKAAGPASR